MFEEEELEELRILEQILELAVLIFDVLIVEDLPDQGGPLLFNEGRRCVFGDLLRRDDFFEDMDDAIGLSFAKVALDGRHAEEVAVEGLEEVEDDREEILGIGHHALESGVKVDELGIEEHQQLLAPLDAFLQSGIMGHALFGLVALQQHRQHPSGVVQ